MGKRKVKRLPVVDADGRLAGIISRADPLAVFDRRDTAIRFWPDPASRSTDARTDTERMITMKTSVKDAMTTQVVTVQARRVLQGDGGQAPSVPGERVSRDRR
jgi:CBS domain-containing protein